MAVADLHAKMKKCRKSCIMQTDWNQMEKKAFKAYLKKEKTQDEFDEVIIHE